MLLTETHPFLQLLFYFFIHFIGAGAALSILFMVAGKDRSYVREEANRRVREEEASS